MIFFPRSPRWKLWSIKKITLLTCSILFWSMPNSESTLSKSESLLQLSLFLRVGFVLENRRGMIRERSVRFACFTYSTFSILASADIAHVYTADESVLLKKHNRIIQLRCSFVAIHSNSAFSANRFFFLIGLLLPNLCSSSLERALDFVIACLLRLPL